MRTAAFVVSEFYQNNRIFNLDDRFVNRDNCQYQNFLLKEKLQQVGIDLSTQDINSISKSDFILYSDMPKELPGGQMIDKSYLIIHESSLIRPDNWDVTRHSRFRKIFTWNDDYVDGIKYFKINPFTVKPPVYTTSITPEEKSQFCILIAGNKMKSDLNELYSERIRAIRWFEKNHPDEFDLFGIGWDKHIFSGPFFIRAFNRFESIQKLFAGVYPSYRGIVDSKYDLLRKYKFSICYENLTNIKGYITEKIFDCLWAGCIPVYWGASNITELIPHNCFIDRRNFKNYEELYSYLKNLPDSEYYQYLDSITSFLNSERSYPFSPECFTETIIREILK